MQAAIDALRDGIIRPDFQTLCPALVIAGRLAQYGGMRRFWFWAFVAGFSVFLGHADLRAAGDVKTFETCFEDMPVGWTVTESFLVPPDQMRAIGTKLGAPMQRLSNTFLAVHGQTIRVNILHAESDAGAEKLHGAISAMKGDPAFCVRDGLRVIEYTGEMPAPALATKISYELGFRPKPREIRYRVTADVATVEKSDYMRFNELCNLFFRSHEKGGGDVADKIRGVAATFRFGDGLTLRAPSASGRGVVACRFSSSPVKQEPRPDGEAVRYEFGNLPELHGVPHVALVAEIVAKEGGLTPTTRREDGALTAATPRWPADDPEIKAMAQKIVAGRQGREGQVESLLRWLEPGQNINSGGPVRGSRWGVKRVLEQKFGHCWDSSDCFVTFCRALKIPCRQIGGWLYGCDGHIWAEVLLDGKGWLQADPTGGGKLQCGIYHIPYFVTEDGEMPILYVSMPRIEILETK